MTQAARGTGGTAEKSWQDRFLAALRRTGNVSAACRASRSSRTSVYRHRDEDREFARLWDEALAEAVDALEAEAWRRAARGTLKPVFYQGAQAGAVREYSDTLLIFLLKGHRPERFRDRGVLEHTGPGGGPIQVREVIVRMPDGEDSEPGALDQ